MRYFLLRTTFSCKRSTEYVIAVLKAKTWNILLGPKHFQVFQCRTFWNLRQGNLDCALCDVLWCRLRSGLAILLSFLRKNLYGIWLRTTQLQTLLPRKISIQVVFGLPKAWKEATTIRAAVTKYFGLCIQTLLDGINCHPHKNNIQKSTANNFV